MEAGGVGSGVNYLTFLVHKRPKLYKSQMFVLYLIHEFSLMINDPGRKSNKLNMEAAKSRFY